MENLSPVEYWISLEPDLVNFTFSGTCELLIQAREPVHEITLNALELAVWNCRVREDERFLDCPFCMKPETEEMTVSLPSEMEGEILLKIQYMGRINDKMAGFYRSQYVAEGETRHIAVTQFEESDARRAFPCFDHPMRKACFEIEMIIDKDLVAISNGPVVEERLLESGKRSVRFQKTPRMSTYLLFFAVGYFEFIEDPGRVLVRAATLPGMTKYAGFGLDFGRKSLEFCEQYYGISYPLPKLDLIAIPDFAFGAMENWGAIAFRENLLLHYPGITSRAGEVRICEVIAHEMAHQWFGNLVTPSDWKYLWLNESFATYFGFGIVDHYYPEWDIWEQFLHSQTDTAFGRDALLETFPIEIPGGEHVVINSSTAPIIYNKGGSILRQIEGYIGNEGFREGLRRYLRRHEYGCASSHHLWEALEEVSERPISRIMKNWVEQPGFPLVEVSREGEELVLTQRRFTYLPGASDQVWLVPLTLKIFHNDGGSETGSVLLEGRETRFRIGEKAVTYKLNPGQTGFYRVRYRQREELDKLGRLISKKVLPPEDRWGLQNDLYALVRSGDLRLEEYLDFLHHYRNENGYLPLISIADNLLHAYLVTQGQIREKIRSTGRRILETVLAAIGLEPNPDERHTTSLLRDQIIYQAALYGSKEAEAFALDQFNSLAKEKMVHPDLMKGALQVGALRGGGDVFSWFDRRFRSTDSEHQRINLLTALGCFADKALITRAQQYAIEEVPSRNKFVLIGSLAANPYAIPLMWDWYRSRLGELEEMHPIHYERVIAAIVPVCGLGKEPEVRAFFEKYPGQKGLAKDVINLSLERLKINSRLRDAQSRGSGDEKD